MTCALYPVQCELHSLHSLFDAPSLNSASPETNTIMIEETFVILATEACLSESDWKETLESLTSSLGCFSRDIAISDVLIELVLSGVCVRRMVECSDCYSPPSRARHLYTMYIHSARSHDSGGAPFSNDIGWQVLRGPDVITPSNMLLRSNEGLGLIARGLRQGHDKPLLNVGTKTFNRGVPP